jgi:hypothetical protein
MKDNKLIAEFMGEKFTDNSGVVQGLNYKLIEKKHGKGNNGFRFHTSWDWLMPVVEKIENGGLDPHELIDKSLRKNNQKRWRSIEDLYNVAVYLIKIHNDER